MIEKQKFFLKWTLKELSHNNFYSIFFAMVIILTTFFSLIFLSNSFNNVIKNKGIEVLGGDIILESTRPISNTDLQKIKKYSTNFAREISFYTMLESNGQFNLVNIRAVDPTFPLNNKLIFESIHKGINRIEPNTIWQLNSGYQINIPSNKDINIGDFKGVYSGIIKNDNFLEYNPFRQQPVFFISLGDALKTGNLRAGSRVKYLVYISISNSNIKALKNTLKLQSYQKWLSTDTVKGNEILNQASSFSLLIASFAVVVSLFVIVFAMSNFIKKQNNTINILKSLGTGLGKIIMLIYSQIFIILFSAIVLSTLICYFIFIFIQSKLSALGVNFDTNNLYQAVIYTLLGSIFLTTIITGFNLRVLLKIRTKIFRIIIPLLFLIFLTFYYYSIYEFITTYKIAIASSLSLLITIFILFFLIKFLIKKSIYHSRSGLLMITLYRLKSYASANAIYITLISICLSLFFVLNTTQNVVIKDWKIIEKSDRPNVFAINIPPSDERIFLENLKNKNYTSSQLYPIFRARIIKVNNKDIVFNKANKNLDREINLTWTQKPPKDNSVIQGKWQNANSVSVEEKTAEKLNIKIGDTISFDIGANFIKGKVTNIRKVKWDNMRPNFYFILSKDILNQIDYTSILSFRVPESESLNSIMRGFPTVTLFDLRKIISSYLNISSQFISIIQLLITFCFASSILLMFFINNLNVKKQIYEFKIYRTIGSSKNFNSFSILIEYFYLAILCCFFTNILLEICNYFLIHYLFLLSYEYNYFRTLYVCLIILVTITINLGINFKKITSLTTTKSNYFS